MSGCTNMFIAGDGLNPTKEAYMMIGGDTHMASIAALPLNLVIDLADLGISSAYFYGACANSIRGCFLYYGD